MSTNSVDAVSPGDEEAGSNSTEIAARNVTRKRYLQSFQLPSLPLSSLQIVGVVVFYISVSVALVVLNKFLLSYSPIKFDFPLFVTWFQLLFALACVTFLGYLNKKGYELKTSYFVSNLCSRSVKLCASIPPFEFDVTVGMDVLPMSIIYVAMLTTNNLCLNYVEVSFFQVPFQDISI